MYTFITQLFTIRRLHEATECFIVKYTGIQQIAYSPARRCCSSYTSISGLYHYASVDSKMTAWYGLQAAA